MTLIDILVLAVGLIYCLGALAVGDRLKNPIPYGIYAVTIYCSLVFFAYYHMSKMGYPTSDKMVDSRPVVVYAVKHGKYALYWVKESHHPDPRVYQIKLDSEEEKKRFRETQGLLKGKKVPMLIFEDVEESELGSGVLVREATMSDLHKKE